MGLSTSKSKTTSNSNSTSNVSQTPTNPPFVQQPIEDLMGRVGAYGGRDPASQVAPASPLQQRAFALAGGLGGRGAPSPLQGGMTTQGGDMRSSSLPLPAAGGGYGQAFDAATALALGAGSAGPSFAGFGGYSTQPVDAAAWTAPHVGASQIGAATGANVPNIGEAARWQANLIGPGAISVGGPGQAGSVTLDPAAQAGRVDASEMIGNFQNPYIGQVYDAAMADFDANAGRVRAAQAAAAAASGAFRGSRNALERSFTEGELARGRATTGSGILERGYQGAVQAALQQAGLDTNVSLANAGFVNDRNLAQGGITRDINLGNARMATDHALGAGDIAARIAIANQQSADGAARDFAASTNDFRTREFGERSAAERERAAAANDFTRAQYEGDSRRLLSQAELEARARSEGAAAENQVRDANANRGARAAEFTAGAYNSNQQFNAGQAEAALARRLQAANSVGSLASAYADAYRGDTALTAQLGSEQRAIDQQQRLAELAQLQAMAQIYGGLPLGLFQGQNRTGTETSSGTQVTRSTPSLYNSILAGLDALNNFQLPSDRSLKRDVERIGATPHGLGLYHYRYLWDADDRPRRAGVMADEVARIAPHALGPNVGRFATVDYDALGLAHLLED